ncbi:ParB/RepB/Spo0J family partition protein [Parafilimonas sp.]|uniref:ParB/RepB/Spo0J family partition protein n=1 Tax=Parafilimonas sp. TaxID=1969739 RepID=UPI0039E36880
MTTSKSNKETLGKGIRSLLKSIDSDLKTTSGTLKTDVVEAATNVLRIPVAQIQPNPKNPRRDFDEAALNELASSLKQFDVVQPITVSKLADGKYQLIAGERRLRAAKIAGLKDLPAYIRQTNDRELLELALLENLQREDLNAIEIGLSYKRMMDELNYTQEQVAERMGKERSTVTNYIRLLKLPPDIQVAVRNGDLSMGHARAVINIDTIDKQLYLFNEIKNKQLSVRQTEELVRRLYRDDNAKAVKSSGKSNLNEAYKRIEDNLASYFSTKVTLKHNSNGKGNIVIEYYSNDELNKILELLHAQAD